MIGAIDLMTNVAACVPPSSDVKPAGCPIFLMRLPRALLVAAADAVAAVDGDGVADGVVAGSTDGADGCGDAAGAEQPVRMRAARPSGAMCFFNRFPHKAVRVISAQ